MYSTILEMFASDQLVLSRPWGSWQFLDYVYVVVLVVWTWLQGMEHSWQWQRPREFTARFDCHEAKHSGISEQNIFNLFQRVFQRVNKETAVVFSTGL